MKEIAKHNWYFTLYQEKEDYIISVVFFNSMVDFSRSFILTEAEKKFNFKQLKTLSENIRNNYNSYIDREVVPTISNED